MKSLRLHIILLIIFLATAQIAYAANAGKIQDFSLPGIDGRVYSLSDFKGKVVIVNFWATWCAACVEEMPSLNRLYRQFRDRGLVVLGVSVDRTGETVKAFLKKHPVDYPVLLDQKGEVFVGKYTIQGLPATYLVDQEEVLREEAKGKIDFFSDTFRGKVELLLKGGDGR